MKYLWKTKKVFLITVLLIVGIFGTASTFALLTAKTEKVNNSFWVADVNTHIDEKFDGDVEAGAIVKKNPAIVNDGPSPAFIRARITISPETDLKLLYGNWIKNPYEENSFEVKEELTETSNMHNWSYNKADGFYYYHVVTAPNTDYETTETLFDAVKIGDSVTQNFDITIYQEAVFAEGYKGGDEVEDVADIAKFFDAVNADNE